MSTYPASEQRKSEVERGLVRRDFGRVFSENPLLEAVLVDSDNTISRRSTPKGSVEGLSI